MLVRTDLVSESAAGPEGARRGDEPEEATDVHDAQRASRVLCAEHAAGAHELHRQDQPGRLEPHERRHLDASSAGRRMADNVGDRRSGSGVRLALLNDLVAVWIFFSYICMDRFSDFHNDPLRRPSQYGDFSPHHVLSSKCHVLSRAAPIQMESVHFN